MVLRSGVIIPFQFRDMKKLIMVGVAEENRELSIWDLKNVVRAAFGIYNFEFRNKKIGFNIPDELLLHYLAQRNDLTNFVIEIGQAYDPSKDNYTLLSNCLPCRCTAQKLAAADFYDVTTNIAHPSHSSISATNSQNSQHNNEEPPHKIRITNVNTISTGATSDSTNTEIEPKIDFDDTVADDTANEPELVGELQQNDQEMHQNEITAPDTAPEMHLEMHFERMQHEFFLQKQHQQQHQQQQQMEALLQEQASNLRQRKERMSKKQKEVYVNFLEQNPLINEHRRNDPHLDRHWNKLADILNSVPQGAVKHVAEWKQTFDNWRYRVFLYARYNSKVSGEDALSSKSFKPLTHTDKRAYSIWVRNPDTAPPDLEKMRNVFVNLEETLQE